MAAKKNARRITAAEVRMLELEADVRMKAAELTAMTFNATPMKNGLAQRLVSVFALWEGLLRHGAVMGDAAPSEDASSSYPLSLTQPR